MVQNINRALTRPTWETAVDAAAAPTAAPTVVTDGEEVFVDKRGEYIHIAVEKTNTATLVVWGWIDGDVDEWFDLGTITFSKSVNESEVLTAVGAYDRVYIQVTAIGGGTVTVNLGQGV